MLWPVVGNVEFSENTVVILITRNECVERCPETESDLSEN